jgi:hypothetical protein
LPACPLDQGNQIFHRGVFAIFNDGSYQLGSGYTNVERSDNDSAGQRTCAMLMTRAYRRFID